MLKKNIHLALSGALYSVSHQKFIIYNITGVRVCSSCCDFSLFTSMMTMRSRPPVGPSYGKEEAGRVQQSDTWDTPAGCNLADTSETFLPLDFPSLPMMLIKKKNLHQAKPPRRREVYQKTFSTCSCLLPSGRKYSRQIRYISLLSPLVHCERVKSVDSSRRQRV